MTTVLIELPADVYQRLAATAAQQQKPVETLLSELVVTHTAPVPQPGERERALAALRAVGLLAEPTPEMRRIAASSTLSLEEAQQILDRTEGPPLSELILEMRGPKK